MTRRIRVLLVDDHALIRQGVRSLLELDGGVEIVGEASGGREAIERTAELRPDVVLMDLSMPDMSGFEATRIIKERHAEVQVLALSMHNTEDYVVRAFESGVSGYILKEADPADLAAAIRAVHGGETFILPELIRLIGDRHLPRERPEEGRSGNARLTAREREVLKLLASGLGDEEIARWLGLSIHTVHTHRANIMAKLGVHRRAELVRSAGQLGLLEDVSSDVLPAD